MAERLPPWLKVRLPSDSGDVKKVAGLLRRHRLNTVCTGARCPNMADCWACGTATIMILGKECTRNCRFCAVATNPTPPAPDPREPAQVADAIAELGLRYAVLTSVTRDDLADGGAEHFVRTVAAIKARSPATLVELLIPDLGGSAAALERVAQSGADVIGHNLETVARLTPRCRDARASFERSLDVLAALAQRSGGYAVKTALLLGLGETQEEVLDALEAAFAVGTRHVAMGQYLAPSAHHEPVQRYWTPEEFDFFGQAARELGYESVASGPLVRSSYKADAFAGAALRDRSK